MALSKQNGDGNNMNKRLIAFIVGFIVLEILYTNYISPLFSNKLINGIVAGMVGAAFAYIIYKFSNSKK